MRVTYEQQRETEVRIIFEAALNNRTNGIRFYQNNLVDSEFVSYFDLAVIARKYASELSRNGVGIHERVLICAENTPEFVIAWFALLQIGAVPVPMPPSSTLAGDNSFVQRLLPLLRHHARFICRRTDYDKWSTCPEADHISFIDIALFSMNTDKVTAQGSIHYPAVNDDCEAFIQYTSGSTSAPKGVVITYRNIVENTAALADAVGVGDKDRFLCWLPLYHDYGLVCNFMLCLLQRCDLVLVTPFAFIKRPIRFLQLVGRHQVTAMCMPNFALEQILNAAKRSTSELESLNLASLEWWSIGAEPIVRENLELIEHEFAPYGLRKGVMAPSYGLAEATVGVSVLRPGEMYRSFKNGASDVVLNGAVIKGFSLRIRDPDENGFGSLFMAGDSVAQYAYLDGEKIRISDEEGYVNTKDMAKIDRGELAIAGRSDEMLCLRGENIFPYDIEAIVRKMSDVEIRRVACFFHRMTSDYKVVLVYETKDPSTQNHRQWHEKIREHVASFSSLGIHEIYSVPTKTIPVTTSGKIQRVKAARLYRDSVFKNVCIFNSQGGV